MNQVSPRPPSELGAAAYLQQYVNPVLEVLGDALVQTMPQDLESFVTLWFEQLEQQGSNGALAAADKAFPRSTGSKEARKHFVSENVRPLLQKLAIECVRQRPADVVAWLNQDKVWMNDDSDGDDDEAMIQQMFDGPRRRRSGISSEKLSEQEMAEWKPPKHEKSADEHKSLRSMIRTSKDGKMHMLFGLVSDETLELVVQAFFIKRVKDGECVIQQGAAGDYFYIVKEGLFEIFVKKDEAGSPKKVFEAGSGFAFGELALMYNAPRSATICAKGDGVVWALDRMAFRMLVVRAQELRWIEYSKFLEQCQIFSDLNDSEREKIVDILQEEDFEDSEAIIEQGQRDDNMFIVREGKAVACITGDSGEVEVKHYQKGDYFGEIALLLGEPRKASVYAVGACHCLHIDRPSARRVLGPMQDILKRNIDKYGAYTEAIKAADSAEKSGKSEDASTARRGSLMGQRRKRGAENLDLPTRTTARAPEPGAGEKGKEGEDMTLKDKVAEDFKRPALVQPDPKFSVERAKFHCFAGITQGQKLGMNKPLHVRQQGVKKQEEKENAVYSYATPSRLKTPTTCALLCQKGQKSSADPTPNQDNFFMVSLESGIDIYGICDGHGPFGHIVSLRLTQTIPHFLTKSKFFPENMEAALNDAFGQANGDLRAFANKEGINCDASGSTGSVMILEEQTIHMGYIGDSRIMLGSWNRHDSRLVECTQDHKPELAEEKARIERTGDPPGEVREVGNGAFRIFIKGQNFPGLTMSRAFGDFACAERGVITTPQYLKFQIQPGDEWYAIVASDGIWEFLEGEAVLQMTAKKLRLKGPVETLQVLVENSRKRWQHYEGDYCDDITALFVQFNTKNEKDTNPGCNHTFICPKASVINS